MALPHVTFTMLHTISTTDVKGAIDVQDGELTKGTLVNSEGNFESAVVRFEKFELVILPTTKSFQELYSEYREKSEIFGNIEEVERTTHSILYKELKGFGGHKMESYIMLYLAQGKAKTYLLEGKGRMLLPLQQAADALKALAIARTFEPAD